MNDLILRGHIQKCFVALYAAHVTIKCHSGQIICITAAEEPVDFTITAVLSNHMKGLPPQSNSFMGIQDIKVIQAQGKILISAVIVWTKGKVTNTGLPIHKKIIYMVGGFHALPVPCCIVRHIITIQHSIRINAPVGFFPYGASGFGQNARILRGCFQHFNHGATPGSWQQSPLLSCASASFADLRQDGHSPANAAQNES